MDNLKTAQAFQQAFLTQPDKPVAPEFGLPARLTAAAVLVPVVNRPEGLTMLLTVRTSHLRDHAGQVSFPGGRMEEGETPEETALREAQEEIGLLPERVRLLGRLPTYNTVTGFSIEPVVALVEPPFDLQLADFEVAETFEPPLSFLMDAERHEYRERLYQGQMRHYWAIPWQGYNIWGATAAILVNLARRMNPSGTE